MAEWIRIRTRIHVDNETVLSFSRCIKTKLTLEITENFRICWISLEFYTTNVNSFNENVVSFLFQWPFKRLSYHVSLIKKN